MMNRIQIFANFARELSFLSKCKERHVAAVIVNKELTQVLSIGINGGPTGLADCMCGTEGKYGCVHAEINALVKCVDTSPLKVMFVTLSPCKQCAAAIINAPGGVGCIYILERWKDDSGVQLLKDAGIDIFFIEDTALNTINALQGTINHLRAELPRRDNA